MDERYPLDDWFDGQIWLLEQGVDFTENVPTFRAGLRYWARTLHQVRLRTQTRYRKGDHLSPTFDPKIKTAIVVQAIPLQPGDRGYK